jgi:hypothetical protein
MKKTIMLLFSGVAMTFASLSIQATLVTFDDQGFVNLQACTIQYAGVGVTFAGVSDGGGAVSLDVSDSTTFIDVNPFSPPFSLSNFYNGDPNSRAHIMQIIFTTPVQNVSFEYNPAGFSGSGTVFNAYNASSTLIASFSDPAAITSDGSWYLESINLGGIKEVDIVNPSPGWGHYIDNLAFESVPEPASLSIVLLGLGLSGAVLLRRRLASKA